MAKKESDKKTDDVVEDIREQNPPALAITRSKKFKTLMDALSEKEGQDYSESMVLEVLEIADYIRHVAAISNTAIDNPRLIGLVVSADKKYFKAKDIDPKKPKKDKKGKKAKGDKAEKKTKGEKTKVPWEDSKA